MLAARRYKCNGLAIVSPLLPAYCHLCAVCIWERVPAYDSFQFVYHLLSRVGGGDISTHRRGLIGSCSSTFQYSAWRRILAYRLRLTSRFPRAPSPCQCTAGYRRFGSRLLIAEDGHSVHYKIMVRMYSKHAQVSSASSMTPSKDGRTTSNITDPRFDRFANSKSSFQNIGCKRQMMFRISRYLEFAFLLAI